MSSSSSTPSSSSSSSSSESFHKSLLSVPSQSDECVLLLSSSSSSSSSSSPYDSTPRRAAATETAAATIFPEAAIKAGSCMSALGTAACVPRLGRSLEAGIWVRFSVEASRSYSPQALLKRNLEAFASCGSISSHSSCSCSCCGSPLRRLSSALPASCDASSPAAADICTAWNPSSASSSSLTRLMALMARWSCRSSAVRSPTNSISSSTSSSPIAWAGCGCGCVAARCWREVPPVCTTSSTSSDLSRRPSMLTPRAFRIEISSDAGRPVARSLHLASISSSSSCQHHSSTPSSSIQ